MWQQFTFVKQILVPEFSTNEPFDNLPGNLTNWKALIPLQWRGFMLVYGYCLDDEVCKGKFVLFKKASRAH